MAKGLLIVNGFVGEQSFVQLRDALMAEAKANGLELEMMPHYNLLFDVASAKPLFDIEEYSFAIFWDKDIRLAAQLERAGLRLFNSAKAIAACDDKFYTHLALSGLPMPKTVAVPMTYKYVGYGDMTFVEEAAKELGLPFVIKECCGSFGKQVYLARTVEEAKAIIASHEAVPMIMQQAITESFGRDKRAYVVGNRVEAAMIRECAEDFRANIANGGVGTACTLTPEEEALALKAAGLMGLDFAGVDLLEGKDGPILCEVNSNAHFRGLESCTGVNIAGAIIRHIIHQLEK